MRISNVIAVSMLWVIIIAGSCAAGFRPPAAADGPGALIQRPDSTPAAVLTIDRTHEIVYTPGRIALLKAYAAAHYGGLYEKTAGSREMPGITIEPRVIVVHYTAVPTLEGTLRVFQPETLKGRSDISGAGNANVGVQFVVDQNGAIHQMTADNNFTRHCIGLNHCAIGIENVGMGDLDETGAGHDGSGASLAGRPGKTVTGEGAVKNLTLAQVDSNARLIRHLKKKYPAMKILIGHMEYRQLEDPAHPGHCFFHEDDPNYRTAKSDPGPRFMAELRKRLTDLLEPGSGGQVFR